MYGDARCPEDKQHDNDELYARLHAIKRKDSGRIPHFAEPKINGGYNILTLTFCLLSILTSRSRSAHTLLYPCFYTSLLWIWSLYTSCGGCLSTGYCVSLLNSFHMTRIPPRLYFQ